MNTVQGRIYDGADIADSSLGTGEYRECSFRRTNMRDVLFDSATLLSCNLDSADLIGATFRLACVQGSHNKLDDENARMFLYWFMHMFDLSPGIEQRLKDIIGVARLDRLQRVFESAA